MVSVMDHYGQEMFVSMDTKHFLEELSSVVMLYKSHLQFMHKSFVTTAPNLPRRLGDSRAKVRGNYFSSVPLSAGEMMGF